MDDSFKNVIAGAASAGLKYLPVCHSCSAKAFKAILATSIVDATPCKFNNFEKLLYLFYGKPSYRVNTEGNRPYYYTADFPIVFLFDIDVLTDIHKLYPFDTGGYHNNVYKEFLDNPLHHFELNPQISQAEKTVSYFFGSNKNYLYTIPKENIASSFPKLGFDIQAYYNLLQGIKDDDRSCSIELQFQTGIKLLPSVIKYIIVPEVFLDDDYILEKLLNDFELDRPKNIADYPCYRGATLEYHGILFDRVNKFLKQHDYL
ncbi:MAG TPA: hypothetical protein VHA56_09175 [Mucilaginibacter sp.]|nr:hypothetical protein [Mucilaginibacter sp.]